MPFPSTAIRPVGYRESFGKTHYDPASDLKGTDALLKVLAAHDVKTTFAVVGKVALPGNPPDHCPDQIREILARGHEVASHSMHQRFLPSMHDHELLEDARASKQALETCIGGSIRGFIPPLAGPRISRKKAAFSFSEQFGLQGRGRGRQSVASLLSTLGGLGFGWCRISYQNSFENLGVKLGFRGRSAPVQPFLFRDLVAVPLHATGFGETSSALLRHFSRHRCPDRALRPPQPGARPYSSERRIGSIARPVPRDFRKRAAAR